MIIFLLILALFTIKPYLATNFPYTHDGENHLARFANYKLALKEGQFPPRFAPNLLNHYGYPVFNYNYPLANIASLPFSFLKIPYEMTFKILLFCFVFFGLFGLNGWLKARHFSFKARIMTLIAFSFSPYLANILYFRGNIGELMAMMIFPWLMWQIDQPQTLGQAKKPWGLLFGSILWAMFFLSHNVMVLFGAPILILFALNKHRAKIKEQLTLLFSIGGGILLSLWFWLPAIFEKNLIILENADLSKGYLNHFPTIDQLFFAPLRFGFSLPGSIDTLSFQIGWPFVLVLITTVVFWKKIKANQLGLFFVVAMTAIFAQLSLSKEIWQIIPMANFVQFPWRLTFFVTLLSLPLLAWFFDNLGKFAKLSLGFLILIQFFVTTNLKPADYFHREQLTYDLYPASTSTANENLPINFSYEYFADGNWQPTAQIISGSGSANIHWWQGSKRGYTLNLETAATVIEPTANFAGWQTKANNETVDYVDSDTIGGRIAYSLPEGQYQITTNFTQNTVPRMIGNSISFFSLLIIFGLAFFERCQNEKPRA